MLVMVEGCKFQKRFLLNHWKCAHCVLCCKH